MAEHLFEWQYDGRRVPMVFEQRGQGSPLLLLPSLSTASMREEMRELAERLAVRYAMTLVDWPGFGASVRLALPYGCTSDEEDGNRDAQPDQRINDRGAEGR